MQSISFAILVISSEVLILLVPIYWPQSLVENDFLQNFINHELLHVLVVTTTVTAASAANLHLALNRAEETIKKPDCFRDARKEINQDAYCLIGLFLAAVIVLVVRSSVAGNTFVVSLLNGVGLIILLMNILVLIDITSAVFALSSLSSQSDES